MYMQNVGEGTLPRRGINIIDNHWQRTNQQGHDQADGGPAEQRAPAEEQEKYPTQQKRKGGDPEKAKHNSRKVRLKSPHIALAIEKNRPFSMKSNMHPHETHSGFITVQWWPAQRH